ncbi:hypothetical protein RUND412_008059 [Rhizina undulata]
MVRLTSFLSATLALTSLSSHVLAHGDESIAAMAARDIHIAKAKRSLAGCSDKLYERSRLERRLAKRNQLTANHLKKRQAQGGRNEQKSNQQSNRPGSQQKSGAVSSSTVSAASTQSTGISGIDDPASLFTEVTCILTPEVTVGPYYVDGELIRSDVRESQEGVDLILDLEVINVNTCEPIENVYLDFWHCNATGVYSGIVASGNGDSSDASNINTTFLRGLQPTDSDGIAQFTTIFPGWYDGRAIHIHISAHINGSVADNGTYIGGGYTHFGQVFFDEDLISSVAVLEPYTTNTVVLLTNSEDDIYPQQNSSGYDALANYELIGDTVGDGILSWISIGIDPTANNTEGIIFVPPS